MVIDFHTHTFPESMADKTVSYLADKAKLTPYIRGTNEELIKSMREAKIDISVLLPVVTSPKHVNTINQLAVVNNQIEGFVSFGGIHPDCDNIEGILEGIKESGLKGIKLHPDYQNTPFDDEKYLRIIEKCFSLGLIVVTHAGIDLGYTDVKCNLKAIKNVLDTVKNRGVLVLAHMGGVKTYEEAIKTLKGYDVYFDLAFSLGKIKVDGKEMSLIDEGILFNYIETFGSERILFATDSPWGDQKNMLETLNSFSISKEDKENILYKNACRLLNIGGK